MLILTTLSLLLSWMLSVDSRAVPQDAKEMSMVDDSVDDMYFNCKDSMMTIIKDKYFENEKKSFANVWNDAINTCEPKFEQREDKVLTREHLQAIFVYTSNRVYEKFNKEVRTGRSIFNSSFQFHSLHYLLTSAIQILNNNNTCHITYRRTDYTFTGKVGQTIRFGLFASSSYRTDLKHFGNESCFKIKTYSGAFLKSYSCYPGEREVLIPPYEMFSITSINDQGEIQGLEDCKNVFVLESAGYKSSLNCMLDRYWREKSSSRCVIQASSSTQTKYEINIKCWLYLLVVVILF